MNIVFEDITLRAIESRDLELLLEIINDPEVENMLLGHSFPIPEKHHEEWYKNLSVNSKELRTVIETKDHGTIGAVMLTDIDWKNRTALFHIKIKSDSDIRGKGYGTKAAKAIINYAFEQLNLNLIYSHIIEYNIASQRLHEKCGFVKEGILRERVYKNGEYHNIFSLSIKRNELKI